MITMMLAALALMSTPAETLVDNALQIQAGEITYTTFFEADGTYTTDVGISGTWSISDGQMCVVRSTGESGCQPVAESLALGDSWEGVNPATGATVTYTVIAR
ncbi:hypothetical protein [uncultured Maricaulis sp.]|uniref:hypothetical protein n=1 Tax=uncultured Maricaulis sp. TaxID=174710 RepID=UPI0030DAB329|tara:strand:- start:143893 stop:144201 length:309 start_codon:yes stop_codon:yes gene_type:complete